MRSRAKQSIILSVIKLYEVCACGSHASDRRTNGGQKMTKISDIQETPNPNAVEFILKEPVTSAVGRQFDSAQKALDDTLPKALFDTGQIVTVCDPDSM